MREIERINQELKKIWPVWQADAVIGQGSFGTVYRIVREGKYVSALKVIRIPASENEINNMLAAGTDHATVVSFYRNQVLELEQEIELMETLKSATHIVGIEDHAIIENPGGVGWAVYIRMELLQSMASYLKNHPVLSEKEVVKIGLDISDALVSCQRQNVIHRDIKPGNIFRSQFGEFKLGDFGIARRLEGAMASTQIGTPSYEAPEIVMGRKYNKTVDIYALGMVLYTYLNKGRKPFLPLPPAQFTAEEQAEAASRRVSGDKLPAPVDASPALAEIILKACAYDPKDRYQTADEFYDALFRYSFHEEEGTEPLGASKDRGEGTEAIGISSGRAERNNTVQETLFGGEADRKTGRGTSGSISPEGIGLPEDPFGGPPKKNSGKGILIGIIVAAALVIIAGGILLYLRGRDNTSGEDAKSAIENKTENEPTPEPVSTETPTPEPAKTEPTSEETPTPEPEKMEPANTETPTPEPANTETPTPEPEEPTPTETPTPEPDESSTDVEEEPDVDSTTDVDQQPENADVTTVQPEISFILDASGSMAFTAETPEKIKVPDSYPRNIFLSSAEVDGILDKEKTDTSKLDYSGYRYYVSYSNDGSDYVPIGYWEGQVVGPIRVGDRDCLAAVNAEKSLMGVLYNAAEGNSGWYYINSGDNDFYENPMLSTAKEYVGLRPDAENSEYRPMNLADSQSAAEWGADPSYGAEGRPIQFFADDEGYLRCYFCRNENDSCKVSYVYERPEGNLTRMEVMENFVSSLCAECEKTFPDARYSVVRFSSGDFESEEVLVQNWTDDEQKVNYSLSQSYSAGTTAGEKQPDGTVLYNYGLTAKTSTRTGFRAYLDLLQSETDQDANKIIILFTDGADSDGLGTEPDENGYNALDYAGKLKIENDCTIISVFLQNSPEGDEQAEGLLQKFASLREDGTPLFVSLYGSSNEAAQSCAQEIMEIINTL